MRAVVCGANGAMGLLIQKALDGQAVGLVSLDGENNVPKTFAELGDVGADVVIDFSHHSAAHQRDLTTAIKRARQIALLPYVAD